MSISTPILALNKAYRREAIHKKDFERFSHNLETLAIETDKAMKAGQTEEHLKSLLSTFLNDTWYKHKHYIRPKSYRGNHEADLTIHNDSAMKSAVGVIIETKKPGSTEMVRKGDLNRKALWETVLYYLWEKVEFNNHEVKHIVITDNYDWCIIDAVDFHNVFYSDKQLIDYFKQWKQGSTDSHSTQQAYEVIGQLIKNQHIDLNYTWFNVHDYIKLLNKNGRQAREKLATLYKLLSPKHLLKQPFENDSNQLNKEFYTELLHIIGLEEVKEGSKKVIRRKAEPDSGSFLENAILKINTEGLMENIRNPEHFGETEDERLFNISLELCITWVNRVLFLKLLEAQLVNYHHGNKDFRFLGKDQIEEFDQLNTLFYEVLAKPEDQRSGAVNEMFPHVPYLNSSLFESTSLEIATLRISNLKDSAKLPVHPQTVLKDGKGKRLKVVEKPTLEYFLEFLDAYDFGAEGDIVQEEKKSIINASVLGLIFEKINGYKEGSFFTPGFITMYMCRETLGRAVADKFNKKYGWKAKDLNDLYNHLEKGNVKEYNELIDSLKICDPAVGSGHFLVSALNELIRIKSELGILCDTEGKVLRGYNITVENDELHVETPDGSLFEYKVARIPPSKGAESKALPGDVLLDKNTAFTIPTETQRIQKALFEEKRQLIENCLFGVDINGNSVKICRLRLWIELLKSAYYKEPIIAIPTSSREKQSPTKSEIASSSRPAAGIPRNDATMGNGRQWRLETLPNIDINIKRGNSLLSRFPLDANLKKALKSMKYNIDDFKNFVNEYKDTTDREVRKGLLQIIDNIKTYFQSSISQNDPDYKKLKKKEAELYLAAGGEKLFDLTLVGKAKEKEKQKLKKLEQEVNKLTKKWEEKKSGELYKEAFEWRFEFPEVLDTDGSFMGFDVVIGNPPYISIQDLKKIAGFPAEVFKQVYKTAVIGNYDIYLLFVERSLDLLNKKGKLNFILPSKFITTDYGKSLRDILVESKSLDRIIDFGHHQIFDTATTYTCLLFLNKFKHDSFNYQRIHPDDIKTNLIDFNQIEIESLKDKAWLLTNKDVSSIINKLKQGTTSLLELPSYISRGSSTGNDEVYCLKKKNGEYLTKHGNTIDIEEELLRYPIYATSFTRYLFKEITHEVVIFPYQVEKNTYRIIDQDSLRKKYPKAYKYLTENKELLGRRKQYKEWYGYSAPRSLSDHQNADILVPLLADRGLFSPTSDKETENYTLMASGGFSITILNKEFDSQYILALINSKLLFWLLYLESNKFRGNWITCTKQYFGKLPIKQLSKVDQIAFINRVNQILTAKKEDPAADTTALEQQIDLMVYKLYGLTYAEAQIVDPGIGQLIGEADYGKANIEALAKSPFEGGRIAIANPGDVNVKKN